MVEDGYEFFAKRQLVTLFSAPNYCGEFDNAGAMMSVDETLMCSFQILKVRTTSFVYIIPEGDRKEGKKGGFLHPFRSVPPFPGPGEIFKVPATRIRLL